MCEDQNNIVYGNFDETLNKKLSELLKNELVTEYRKGWNEIIRQYCHLFFENLHKLLEKSVSEIFFG